MNTIGRTCVVSSEINKHALPITMTISREFRLSIQFCRCFIVELLVQRKFCCGNLIDRSRRTQKTNQITPTYLGPYIFNFLRARPLTLHLHFYIREARNWHPSNVDEEISRRCRTPCISSLYAGSLLSTKINNFREVLEVIG